jgi:hypothetical protein
MFCKNLIRYNKINGIIHITIHVQTTHPRLFTKKKQLNEKVAKYVTHVWQFKKKITTLFGYAITIFLVPQTPTKELVNNNNNFLEDLVQFICKHCPSPCQLLRMFGFAN